MRTGLNVVNRHVQVGEQARDWRREGMNKAVGSGGDGDGGSRVAKMWLGVS